MVLQNDDFLICGKLMRHSLSEFFHLSNSLSNASESKNHSVASDSLLPHGLYRPWTFPGQNTGVRSHSLLQGIFPTQGSNPGLLHCRQILYQLSHQGNPFTFTYGIEFFGNFLCSSKTISFSDGSQLPVAGHCTPHLEGSCLLCRTS